MSKNSVSLKKLRLITLTGVFSAMIFVFTAYLHIPTGSGYTHAGDGLLFLAACILPAPYAMAAGAIGGALADGLSGFPVWIPATIAIKALTVLFFSNKGDKIVTLRNILAAIPSFVLCAVGYSLYESIVMTGAFSVGAIAAAFTQTFSYFIQISASTILFVVVGTMLDKAGFKKIIKY